ncbi:glycosyltransferase family 2 protein [Paenibacillus lautus]|uniref:glycosyltransferase family 2 protein n=1 Tax=Paenibacillus lautus TaxID=1401 RepID=UPI002DBD21ED|nr:glycosyltransferase family 2 protein [Paenibacillus lautus]MEC0310683.1 glycosyltransferase family 2 protein [Paenibacillus lautus]
MNPTILLIIPAYNEEQNIRSLIDAISSIKYSYKVDVLIIDDCSTDNTLAVCNELNLNVINLPCNLGIGGAVQTGYKYANKNKYDIAIQVDGDGQHDPAFIVELLDPILNNEADMVIGSRYINKLGFQSTLIRRIGISYFSKLIKVLTKQEITDPTSGFRACNKRTVELFSKRYPVDYPEPESIMYLKRKGYRIKEVPVHMKERVGGKSSITSVRSIYYMTKVSLAILIDKMRKQVI